MTVFKDVFFNLGLPFSILNVLTNIVCFIVFMQKKFRSTSTGFYLQCLAVADIAQTYLIIGYYLQKFKIQIATLSTFFCQLHNYLGSTLPIFPSWILVTIAVDRFISVYFVQYSSILNKRRIQISVIICLISIVSVLNSVNFYFYRLVTDKNSSSTTCSLPSEFANTSSQLKIYNCIIVTTMFPFLIMTVSNVLTTTKLVSSKKQVIAKNKSTIKEIKFGVTVVTLNLLFFIFNTPVCSLMLLIKYKVVVSDSYDYIFYALIFLRYSHSCLQFFIYLGVNRIFRSEFIRLTQRFIRIENTKFASLVNSWSNSTTPELTQQTKLGVEVKKSDAKIKDSVSFNSKLKYKNKNIQ